MTLDQFIDKWDGKFADFDGAYGAQCFDLFRFYVKEVWGLPQFPATGTQGAKVIFDQVDETVYKKIPNTPDGVPEKGDVLIYDGRAGGGYGHVVVVISADINNIVVFEQNRPTNSPCHIGNANYSACRGWFRPINGNIEEEPINSEMDIRLKLLDDYRSSHVDDQLKELKTESQIRDGLDRVCKFIGLQIDKDNADKALVEYKESRLQIDKDNKLETERLEALVKAKEEVIKTNLRKLAEIGATRQDWDEIATSYQKAVNDEGGAVITPNPFQGIGDRIRIILDLLIKKLKWNIL